MNLEKLLTLIAPLHYQELQPSATTATILSKRKDCEQLDNPTTRAITMGLFYETLTSLFYGGVLGASFSPVTNELSLLTKPDIVNHDTKHFYECKSVRNGHHGMFLDTQLNGYDQLQEHFPDYSTSFAIYRHTLPGIKSSWQGTTNDLFQELSQKTAYLVLLPYSIVQQFQTVGQSGVSSSLVSRYDNPQSTYDTCTCLRSSTLTTLATEPERVIDDLKIDREQFTINRYRSPGCWINSIPLRRFLIIQIDDLEKPNSNRSSIEQIPF